MKFDKGELFITVVWVLTIFFVIWLINKNVNLQSDIATQNRNLQQLYQEYCPKINYNTKECKEFKEEQDLFKIGEELEKEAAEESRQNFIYEQTF
ncbi:hypothetical protein IJI31_01120 [bacterium]|nr:hypothetical protein [bacterium]